MVVPTTGIKDVLPWFVDKQVCPNCHGLSAVLDTEEYENFSRHKDLQAPTVPHLPMDACSPSSHKEASVLPSFGDVAGERVDVAEAEVLLERGAFASPIPGSGTNLPPCFRTVDGTLCSPAVQTLDFLYLASPGPSQELVPGRGSAPAGLQSLYVQPYLKPSNEPKESFNTGIRDQGHLSHKDANPLDDTSAPPRSQKASQQAMSATLTKAREHPNTELQGPIIGPPPPATAPSAVIMYPACPDSAVHGAGQTLGQISRVDHCKEEEFLALYGHEESGRDGKVMESLGLKGMPGLPPSGSLFTTGSGRPVFISEAGRKRALALLENDLDEELDKGRPLPQAREKAAAGVSEELFGEGKVTATGIAGARRNSKASGGIGGSGSGLASSSLFTTGRGQPVQVTEAARKRALALFAECDDEQFLVPQENGRTCEARMLVETMVAPSSMRVEGMPSWTNVMRGDRTPAMVVPESKRPRLRGADAPGVSMVIEGHPPTALGVISTRAGVHEMEGMRPMSVPGRLGGREEVVGANGGDQRMPFTGLGVDNMGNAMVSVSANSLARARNAIVGLLEDGGPAAMLEEATPFTPLFTTGRGLPLAVSAVAMDRARALLDGAKGGLGFDQQWCAVPEADAKAQKPLFSLSPVDLEVARARLEEAKAMLPPPPALDEGMLDSESLPWTECFEGLDERLFEGGGGGGAKDVADKSATGHDGLREEIEVAGTRSLRGERASGDGEARAAPLVSKQGEHGRGQGRERGEEGDGGRTGERGGGGGGGAEGACLPEGPRKVVSSECTGQMEALGLGPTELQGRLDGGRLEGGLGEGRETGGWNGERREGRVKEDRSREDGGAGHLGRLGAGLCEEGKDQGVVAAAALDSSLNKAASELLAQAFDLGESGPPMSPPAPEAPLPLGPHVGGGNRGVPRTSSVPASALQSAVVEGDGRMQPLEVREAPTRADKIRPDVTAAAQLSSVTPRGAKPRRLRFSSPRMLHSPHPLVPVRSPLGATPDSGCRWLAQAGLPSGLPGGGTHSTNILAFSDGLPKPALSSSGLLLPKKTTPVLHSLHRDSSGRTIPRPSLKEFFGRPPALHPKAKSLPMEVRHMSSTSATSYAFPNESGSSEPPVGPSEMRRLLLEKGASPSSATEEWIQNHYRWIVWKLACYERGYPDKWQGRLLTISNVLTQLEYRYEREINQGHRSAVRKVMERDQAASRPMILCVAAIEGATTQGGEWQAPRQALKRMDEWRRGGPQEEGEEDGGRRLMVLDGRARPGVDAPAKLELTDGWYGIKAVLDKKLTKLVQSGKISVGQKLQICGAHCVGNEGGVSPLEGGSNVSLMVHVNGAFPAHWAASLGFCKGPTPPLALAQIKEGGGLVTQTLAGVVRVYPLLYRERLPNGGGITRTGKAEDIAGRLFEDRRQSVAEAATLKAERDLEAGSAGAGAAASPLGPHVGGAAGRRRRRSEGQRLLERAEAAGDPEGFLECLTEEQRRTLEAYRLQQQDEKRAEADKVVQLALAEAELSARDVTTLLKVRVRGLQIQGQGRRGRDSPAEALITLWRPTDEQLQEIVEGGVYRVTGLVTTSESSWRMRGQDDLLHLNTTHSTTWEKLAPSSLGNLRFNFEPRTATSIAALGDLTGTREFDVALLILHVGAPHAVDWRLRQWAFAIDGSTEPDKESLLLPAAPAAASAPLVVMAADSFSLLAIEFSAHRDAFLPLDSSLRGSIVEWLNLRKKLRDEANDLWVAEASDASLLSSTLQAASHEHLHKRAAELGQLVRHNPKVIEQLIERVNSIIDSTRNI